METSRSEDSANSFSVSTASSNRKRAYRTSRAHFYWVTREAGSFEWFKGVMNEVAEMDKKVESSVLIMELVAIRLDVFLVVPSVYSIPTVFSVLTLELVETRVS